MMIDQPAIRIALVLALLLGGAAQSSEWMTDFEAAKAKAKKEEKSLLVSFSGSDWCGWCIRLEKEVFSQEAFVKEARKRYVLVNLDFPRKKQLPAELKAQNGRLRTRYGVRAFPSVYLMIPSGDVYAVTGYQPGGPETYLENLNKMERGRPPLETLVGAIEATTGQAKALNLQKLVQHYEIRRLPVTDDLIDQVLKADPDDLAGLKKEYLSRQGFRAFVEEIQKAKSALKALPAVEKALKNKSITGRQRVQITVIKAGILHKDGKQQEAMALLKQAETLAQDGQMKAHISNIMEQISKPQTPPAQ